MNFRGWVAAFLLGCSLGASAQTPIAEASTSGITFASTEAALEALRGKPGVTEWSKNDWIIIDDQAEHVLWSITTPKNVLHPSMVKRVFVEKEGVVTVEMSIKCGVSKEACDGLVRAFRDLNDRLRDNIRARGEGLAH